MRTYELPWHGIAQVLDRPKLSENELPFIPEKEALYYNNITKQKSLFLFFFQIIIIELSWLTADTKER